MANSSAVIAEDAPIRLNWERILVQFCVKSATTVQLYRKIHLVIYPNLSYFKGKE